jgi:hypothetical protein
MVFLPVLAAVLALCIVSAPSLAWAAEGGGLAAGEMSAQGDSPISGVQETDLSGGDSTGDASPAPAQGLSSNVVAATRINGKQAVLRWKGVSGADGYYVYQGKKKIKTLSAAKRKYTVKRKGAGKAKFRVIPFSQANGTVATGGSNTVKPRKNVVTFSFNKNPKAYQYWTCAFKISKVQLTGKTYTITGFALNNRMWKILKYKNFRIKLYVDGKCVLNKKVVKNINAKRFKAKRVKLKLKGKAGVDLRNGSVKQSVTGKPIWVDKNGKVVK